MPAATALRLRDATPADASALIALDSVAASDPRRAEQIGEWPARVNVHVAEQEREIVGYMTLHEHFFGEAFIEMLMVAREHRSQGVGATLLRHVIAQRGQRKLFTSTNASNFAMQRLLVASGFIDSGIVHGLDEGDPELIYRFAGS
ncbi:GNAT family N-acetyltransferase [Stenotrophomonas maltophilia]|uniref:GNAT family N-acetyltransferase n=1 Tax=Stenotrophomonas maltophilia TaxID=40324 RepID=UPI0012B0F975|nr:GNAT family N-acetyltransferase [Stenotrophomonas maltophilia]QGM06336.1 GNAT family N-acetyltransferase [Stenotrophomonas maltophilia]